MLGEVRDHEVLDAGCGGGGHALELLQRGARVIGLDRSQGMLDVAAARLGQGVPLVRASLEDRLPFADDSFDAILASLVMHYLEDWAPSLQEFRRILRPTGRLVIPTHHPFMDHALANGESYLQTYSFTEEWQHGGHPITMRFRHHPISAMIEALLNSGFTIAAVEEPLPDPVVRTWTRARGGR